MRCCLNWNKPELEPQDPPKPKGTRKRGRPAAVAKGSPVLPRSRRTRGASAKATQQEQA